MDSNHPLPGHLQRVWRYYDRTESRLGYEKIMRGRKHYGWYEAGDSALAFVKAQKRMESELADRLDLRAGAVVLDAGCGMGEVARELATTRGWQVEGIDILDFNLEWAKAKSKRVGLADKTNFQWGDYHDLQFPEAHFDGLYTMETLSHSSDFRKVLGEFYRVLKPGGRGVLVEYSRTPASDLSAAANEALEKVCTIAAMPAWLELEHGLLEEELAKAGFADVRAENVTETMMPMLKVFSIGGRFPYWVGRKIGRPEKTVNAMSGVEMYRHPDAWAYQIYSFRKPE